MDKHMLLDAELKHALRTYHTTVPASCLEWRLLNDAQLVVDEVHA
jgi:hypothetical protein